MLIKKTLITLFCLVLFNIVYGQSNVFNQNYNYTGNILTNPTSGSQYYNNETFNSCIEKDNKYICFGESFNQRSLFPTLITQLKYNGLILIKDYNEENLLLLNDYNNSVISVGNWMNDDFIHIGGGTTNNLQNEEEFTYFGFLDSMVDTFFTGLSSNSRGIFYSEFYERFILVSSVLNYEDSINISIDFYNSFFQRENSIKFSSYYFNQAREIYLKDSILIMSGLHFENPNFSRGLFLLKYNLNSQEINWSKKYSSNSNQIFVPRNSTHTFQNQNFYLVGNTILSGGGPFPAVEGGLLIKTDSVGNELWQKT